MFGFGKEKIPQGRIDKAVGNKEEVQDNDDPVKKAVEDYKNLKAQIRMDGVGTMDDMALEKAEQRVVDAVVGAGGTESEASDLLEAE